MNEENKKCGCVSCGSKRKFHAINMARWWFKLLSNEERMEILLDYCKYCGIPLLKNERCVCQNDE